MKPILLFLVSVLALTVSGCGESRGANRATTATAEAAATFKAGHGLRLTPLARDFNRVVTADFNGRVPAAAVLRTVEGTFLYVENAGWLLRTPVMLGANEGVSSEVKEGLYEGDRVVVEGTKALWLAELHALRAGQACAHEG